MPENVPYAREVLNAFPTTPTPATDYYVRVDGRIQHYISDLAAPHTLRPVSFNVAVTGGAPPTDVTRTGALTSTQTYGSLASARQRFRPAVNIPVTGVQVDQLTVSGSAAVAFHDLTTGTWVGAAAASQVGAGITSPVSGQLLAGHEYFLHVGALGAGVNGTEYTGAVSGVTLSSGHAWTGLTLTAPPTVFESATPVTAGAQLAFQLLTGDMTGFDPSGVTHKAENGATIAYDAATRTYTHGASLDLSQWGASSSAQAEAWAGSVDSMVSGMSLIRWTFTALTALDLTSVTLPAPLVAAGPQPMTATITVGDVAHPAVIDGATLSPNSPLAIPPGPWALDVTGAVSYPLWDDVPQTSVSTGGSVRFDATYRTGTTEGEVIALAEPAMQRAPQLTLHLGTASVYGTLPAAAFPGLGALETQVADHAARITALEARPTLSAEYVQDVVGSMIPGATYDDAAGTLTLPADQTADPETIRDLVAAFAVAGTGVTITHNDAGDTLTISATGGSLPAPGTAGNVLTSTGAEWVSAPAPTGGEGSGPAYLYTGYASVESPPTLTMTDEMNANAFGASMDLRYTAAQAGSVQAVTLRLRGYDPSNDARIDVHRITDGTWTAGAGTLVGSLPLNALGTSMVTRTLSLPSAVTFASNDRLVLRLVPVSAALLMVDATQNGQALPYLLPNGVLRYAAGQSSSGNNDAIGTRIPNVAWQSQVSKTTVGPSISAGATALRPPNPQPGDQHYDTTLGKPVWWSGSAWKDATGTNA